MQNDLKGYKHFIRHYYRLYVKGFPRPVGYVHHSVIVEMPWPDCWTYDSKDNSLIFDGGNDIQERNEKMRKLLIEASVKARKQKEEDMPLGPVRQLSYEHTPVYSHDGQHIMDVDNAATELLGVPMFTVALTAWTYVDGHRQYWVPQRSFAKTDSPGKFGNLASGTLGPGETPFNLIKQLAHKQAWLAPIFTNTALRSCGPISYHTWKHKAPFRATAQPHIQFVYEIELAKDRQPGANAEVKSLKLLDIGQVWSLLASGEIEEHAQMTYLAHFVRHGYINAENEPKLQEIQTRLHRRVEFPDV
jgi:hypothetical protein